jgi:ribosomal protein L11 methyltransferase
MTGVRLFTWRKLSGAKWEDAWWERLAWVRDRLSITALTGRSTIRLQAFQLSRMEAKRLFKAFGGEIADQRKAVKADVRQPRPAIRIRDRLLIVATARERSEAPMDRPQALVIPPGMAFGTGDHATTACCLRFLADVSEQLGESAWRMLDLGTGTGILAIAGRMLGACEVTALDADAVCVRIAREKRAGKWTVTSEGKPDGRAEMGAAIEMARYYRESLQ